MNGPPGLPVAVAPLLTDDPPLPSAKLQAGHLLTGRFLAAVRRSPDGGLRALADALGAPPGLVDVLAPAWASADEVFVGVEPGRDGRPARHKLYLGRDRGLGEPPAPPVDGRVVHLAAKWAAGQGDVTWAWYVRRTPGRRSASDVVAEVLGPDAATLATAVAPLADRADGATSSAQRILEVVESSGQRRSIDLLVGRPRLLVGEARSVLEEAAEALGHVPVSSWLDSVADRPFVRLAVGRDGVGQPFVTVFHR